MIKYFLKNTTLILIISTVGILPTVTQAAMPIHTFSTYNYTENQLTTTEITNLITDRIMESISNIPMFIDSPWNKQNQLHFITTLLETTTSFILKTTDNKTPSELLKQENANEINQINAVTKALMETIKRHVIHRNNLIQTSPKITVDYLFDAINNFTNTLQKNYLAIYSASRAENPAINQAITYFMSLIDNIKNSFSDVKKEKDSVIEEDMKYQKILKLNRVSNDIKNIISELLNFIYNYKKAILSQDATTLLHNINNKLTDTIQQLLKLPYKEFKNVTIDNSNDIRFSLGTINTAMRNIKLLLERDHLIEIYTNSNIESQEKFKQNIEKLISIFLNDFTKMYIQEAPKADPIYHMYKNYLLILNDLRTLLDQFLTKHQALERNSSPKPEIQTSSTAPTIKRQLRFPKSSL